MSSQPVPSMAQAGSGHWRCPLQEEEEEVEVERGEMGEMNEVEMSGE